MPYKSRWSIPIPDASLPTFLFQSASHQEPAALANKPAYIDSKKPETNYLTRAGLKLWSQRFALGLTRLPHFKPGDRVLLFSGNHLGFPIAFMGIIMAGGIFTAANPTFTARELANQLKDSGASYLFCTEDSLAAGLEAAGTAGLGKDRVRWFDADYLFEGSSKEVKNGVEYWNRIFASENEAKSYQWPELKGELRD